MDIRLLILHALLKLDPANDNHWTNQGLPRMDVVEKEVGDKTIKRQDIVDAAPEFTRETLKLPADFLAELEKQDAKKEEDPPVDDSAVKSSADDSIDRPLEAIDQEESTLSPAEIELAQIEDQIEIVRKHKVIAENNLEGAKNQLAAVNEELNGLLTRRERLANTARNDVNNIQEYLTARQKIKIERAESMKKLQEAGFDLSRVQSKSQLDMSMARKTGRGGNRPSFTTRQK
jgi:chromosome segregation ATPase